MPQDQRLQPLAGAAGLEKFNLDFQRVHIEIAGIHHNALALPESRRLRNFPQRAVCGEMEDDRRFPAGGILLKRFPKPSVL